MSDRINSFVVVLDRDYRLCDDAQAIITALQMVKGVISVTPNVVDMENHIAYVRARTDIEKSLFAALERSKFVP